jgi:tRNA(Arg) A34 adenosine deaminase TadA
MARRLLDGMGIVPGRRVGVGAVLADSTGAIVSRGRNQRFGPAGPRRLLAHAEMEALAAVPAGKDRASGAVLSTTLHPCPMCLGAIVVARVGELRFAAWDPTWLGIEQLPALNEEMRWRWPSVTGPLDGPPRTPTRSTPTAASCRFPTRSAG